MTLNALVTETCLLERRESFGNNPPNPAFNPVSSYNPLRSKPNRPLECLSVTGLVVRELTSIELSTHPIYSCHCKGRLMGVDPDCHIQCWPPFFRPKYSVTTERTIGRREFQPSIKSLPVVRKRSKGQLYDRPVAPQSTVKELESHLRPFPILSFKMRIHSCICTPKSYTDAT